MTGRVIRIKWISRQFVQEHQNWLFLFGDNMLKQGYGGQAAEMRNEPNCVGVPTKHWPSMDEKAFFSPDDYDNQAVINAIFTSFKIAREHCKYGGTLVIPTDGLGTNRARLTTCAPKLFTLITAFVRFLEEEFPDDHQIYGQELSM